MRPGMYKSTGKQHPRPILWSTPSSSWSAKIRSYLVKAGINHEERFPSDERFSREIVPLIGYYVIPATELEDGTLLQDTTQAIEHFESTTAGRYKLIPQAPLRRAVAYLLNFIGTNGFLKPGMHYRWSFRDRQQLYLESEFLDWIPSTLTGAARSTELAKIMEFFNQYLPPLGISKDSFNAIETSWLVCLDKLEQHFAVCPYLLGSEPTIADCGLMTMFHAHLSRDPHPASLMRTRAPRVFRWVERMTRPDHHDGGFPGLRQRSDMQDEVPSTLMPFLEYLVSDVFPEIAGEIGAYEEWLSRRSEAGAGDYLDDPNKLGAHPICGEFTYKLRGASIKRAAMIDTIFQMQRVREVVEAIPTDDRRRLEQLIPGSTVDLLARCPDRRIHYRHYRYALSKQQDFRS